ncbi:MAG: glycosyltransferase family 2 protein [Anaerolineales bacterium]|nr:glycosyltransferase family 2 protein [Anaerolineales bacterium]
MKLTVLLPIYNEERELAVCLDRVLASSADEIIAVDDCSTDATPQILARYRDPRLRVIRHAQNRGKGGGIQTALEHATGDYCIIQDADTEYDPRDYAKLLEPIQQGRAQVVYGARDLSTQPLIGHLGNKFLTMTTNILCGTRLDDMETCYKLAPTALLRGLRLQSRGFEIEPEITAKIAKRGVKIINVPVSYAPRPDKKLRRFRDGFRSLFALIKYRFVE